MGSSWDEVNAQFGRRLDSFRAMSFHEVRSLSSERFQTIGKFVVTEWVTHRDESETWIVVQSYRPWILGIGFMQAQGIKKYEDGRAIELSEDELGPYS